MWLSQVQSSNKRLPCHHRRVRETLDFSARVQGVGLKPEELRILRAKEKGAGHHAPTSRSRPS